MKMSFINGTNSELTVNPNNIPNPEALEGIGYLVNGILNIGNLSGEISITNNINSRINSSVDLKVIEIRDNSVVKANLDFAVDEISLINGSLDLTYTGGTPCTSKLNYSNTTEFVLKSSAGFDMKIVFDNDQEQHKFNLIAENNEISSIGFDQLSKKLQVIKDYQLIEKCRQIESCIVEYPLQLLRKYFNLTNQVGSSHILLTSNLDTKKIESSINDNFFELTLIAKSLEGSNLETLPQEILTHITSYLKPSDINLLGDVQADETSILEEDVSVECSIN